MCMRRIGVKILRGIPGRNFVHRNSVGPSELGVRDTPIEKSPPMLSDTTRLYGFVSVVHRVFHY